MNCLLPFPMVTVVTFVRVHERSSASQCAFSFYSSTATEHLNDITHIDALVFLCLQLTCMKILQLRSCENCESTEI
jgi:hypothetical protein